MKGCKAELLRHFCTHGTGETLPIRSLARSLHYLYQYDDRSISMFAHHPRSVETGALTIKRIQSSAQQASDRTDGRTSGTPMFATSHAFKVKSNTLVFSRCTASGQKWSDTRHATPRHGDETRRVDTTKKRSGSADVALYRETCVFFVWHETCKIAGKRRTNSPRPTKSIQTLCARQLALCAPSTPIVFNERQVSMIISRLLLIEYLERRQ